MNIHESVLQPIPAFIYCNPRQSPAGRSWKFPCACATNSAHWRSFAKIFLWWNHTWNKIILGRST